MKTLVLLVLGLLSVVVMISFVVGVDSVPSVQEANATITADLNLIATPDPIGFGSLKPGESSVVQQIILTPGSSSLNITVSVEPGLFQNIIFDLGAGAGYLPIGSELIMVTNNTAKTFNSRLDVHLDFKSGFYSGKITYLVMEA